MTSSPPFDLVIFDCNGVLVDRTNLRAVAGVHDVLDGLASRTVATCVVSQSQRTRVDLTMSATDLARYFDDRVYTASLVPRGKPLPDLFLYAATRMGAEPRRCAVIEGSASGVRAAGAAGMRVFAYATNEDPAELTRAGATTFRSMEELPGLLERAPGDGAGGRRGPQPEAVVRLREAYEAFGAGDGRLLAQLLADDVTYHLPGRHLGGGILHGRTEVFERTARASRSCDGPPTIRLHGVGGYGEWVLSIERFAARRRGQAIDQDVCVVWRMVGAQCVEIWSRFSDQASCDRFWQET
jgi:beta-phosphoglucomutase-like phosphatase (HAD superfamily)/ketosteroid isomerase-like protein